MNETHDTPTLDEIGTGAADVDTRIVDYPLPYANAAITVTHEDDTVAYELRVKSIHRNSYEARWELTDQLVAMLMNGEGVEGMIAARLIEGILKGPRGEFRRAQARELLQEWDEKHPREAGELEDATVTAPAPALAPLCSPDHEVNHWPDETEALNTEGPPAAA